MGMNVNLTPYLEDMVRQKINSGLYTSASEVVREALRLMDEQDSLRAAKLEQLRQDIRAGLDSGSKVPWNPDQVKQDRLDGKLHVLATQPLMGRSRDEPSILTQF